MRKIATVLCLALPAVLCTFHAIAIDASASHSVFYRKSVTSSGEGKEPVMELYWQVNPRTLHFVTNEKKAITAAVRTDIVITQDGHVPVADHFIFQTPPRTDPGELSRLVVMELRNYPVHYGELKVEMKLTDQNDTLNTYTYRDDFEIDSPAAVVAYSSLMFADTIVGNSASTPFLKYGKQVAPLCADFLDDNKRNLHFFTELYGLGKLPASRFPLTQRIRISKKANEQFLPDFEYVDTITGATTFSTGTMEIGALGSGNYYLSVSLADNKGYYLANRSRFFQRMNLHPDTAVHHGPKQSVVEKVFEDTAIENVTVLDLDKTFVSKYPLRQIRAILKMLLPVSTDAQVATINNFLKKPDEMYMQYFIYNYFSAINKKDPAKAWKDYSEKVIEVNKKFNSQGTAGYETDRGYIYLRYGAPTDIIKVPNETGSLPYEIWQYNVLTQFSNKKELSNALFLFYKPGQMLSDYRLLHSTVTGEVKNFSWRNYLYSSQSSGQYMTNSNSRAEQYFGNR